MCRYVLMPARGRKQMRLMREPNEGAFTFSIPDGWSVEGGIYRENPSMWGSLTQSVEAKIDMIIKKDPQGTIMLRLLPGYLHIDSKTLAMSMAGAFFPPGSMYNGMPVIPLLPAQEFLMQVLVPRIHPRRADIHFLGGLSLPQLAMQKARQSAQRGLSSQYDAAAIQYEYQENGIQFRERAFTYIQNMGPMAGGMWRNEDSHILRAPVSEYVQWEGVMDQILKSIQLDEHWIMKETQGQAAIGSMALDAQRQAQRRDQQILDVQRDVQRLDSEIVTHRQRTNEEIQNDMFVTLTGQEEYENPYTGDIDRVENLGKYRWVNSDNQSVFTDDPFHDPNTAPDATRTDYKRSSVRPRFPE